MYSFNELDKKSSCSNLSCDVLYDWAGYHWLCSYWPLFLLLLFLLLLKRSFYIPWNAFKKIATNIVKFQISMLSCISSGSQLILEKGELGK